MYAGIGSQQVATISSVVDILKRIKARGINIVIGNKYNSKDIRIVEKEVKEKENSNCT